MQQFFKISIIIILIVLGAKVFSQKTIEHYEPIKKDSLRTGTGDKDFMPFIQKGYTLMLPETTAVKGVLIFLEDSGYDNKNKSAKQLYAQANENGFAVLSVSSEIPFDFYFSKTSLLSTHQLIKEVFNLNNLPNNNVFFLGGSLVGHRAMRYIKFMMESNHKFQLNINGIVICNFTLDWTRKWYQHKREIRIKRNNLWEPKFINYMLETHLKGTPKTTPDTYHNFSSYSYSDEKNRNIHLFNDFTIRAYVEPAIKYKLTQRFQTMYENNTTDIVGFLAELKLAGNENTELVVIHPKENVSEKKTTQGTWNLINKDELMNYILTQTKK